VIANIERTATRVKTNGKQRFVLRFIPVSFPESQVRYNEGVFSGLKVGAVISSNQGNLVITVQFTDFSDKILYLVGFFHANAVDQLG
jgi:hypothetical protein